MVKEQKIAKRNCSMINVNSYPGKLIVFEGNDGSGKSTAAKNLSKFLKSNGINNKIMKFNMSSVTISSIKIGKKRFFGPYTNTLLHLTSIVDQLERYALNEMKKGNIIICDRYIYSIIARGLVRGVPRKLMLSLTDWLPMPDIVFFFDLEPSKAIKRVGIENISFWEAGKDVIYNKTTFESFIEFQTKVYNEFLRYAYDWDFIHIDANQEQVQILEEIVGILKNSILKDGFLNGK